MMMKGKTPVARTLGARQPILGILPISLDGEDQLKKGVEELQVWADQRIREFTGDADEVEKRVQECWEVYRKERARGGYGYMAGAEAMELAIRKTVERTRVVEEALAGFVAKHKELSGEILSLARETMEATRKSGLATADQLLFLYRLWRGLPGTSKFITGFKEKLFTGRDTLDLGNVLNYLNACLVYSMAEEDKADQTRIFEAFLFEGKVEVICELGWKNPRHFIVPGSAREADQTLEAEKFKDDLEKIVEHAREKGGLAARDVEVLLGVSHDTALRRLHRLEELGLLTRHRGQDKFESDIYYAKTNTTR